MKIVEGEWDWLSYIEIAFLIIAIMAIWTLRQIGWGVVLYK